MLARSSYDKAYVRASRDFLHAQLDALGKKPAVVPSLVLALEMQFVHRLRGAEGKDGNPLNEVRLYASSILEHGGAMTIEGGIKLDPTKTVAGIAPGERVQMSVAKFRELADAFYAELERRFVA